MHSAELPPELTQAGASPVRGQVSTGRKAAAVFFRIFLPTSGAACLWYGFTHPDDTPLVPTKLPPELQYAMSQKNPNQETLTNWSGTHEATPKSVSMLVAVGHSSDSQAFSLTFH